MVAEHESQRDDDLVQLGLLPEQGSDEGEGLEIDDRWLALKELPPDNELEGPPPGRELVESIRRLGLLTPIVVRETGVPSQPYEVLAGRRRIEALRQIHESPEYGLPARVVLAPTEALSDVVILSDNALRRANPVSDLRAILRLVEVGADEKQIARATGLAPGTIRKRLRLHDELDARLLAAVIDGRLAMGVAEQIVGLAQPVQERLVARLEAEGRLTGPDVQEERRARVREAVASLSLPGLDEEQSGGTANVGPSLPPGAPDRTHAEKAGEAYQLATELLALGLQHGDRLTVTGPDGQPYRVLVELIGTGEE